MSSSTVDGKLIEASADYFMRLLKQLHQADRIVEIAQKLCREGGRNAADEMLEQYKKCSEENKKRFAECMKCFADYTDGLYGQKALADQIVKRADAGEFAN